MKRCRRHTWKIAKIIIHIPINSNPGAVNTADSIFPPLMMRPVCTRCWMIKNKKTGEEFNWET